MKERPCKYGERVNGKCPPKPKTTQTKTKKITTTRPCKYGDRINGKCPPKPKNVSVKKSIPTHVKQDTEKTKNTENGEKKITITRDNLYQVGDNHYFKIKIGNGIHRDIDVELNKNSKATLIPIAKLLDINTNIKKPELVEILNNRLQFEK